MHELEINYHIYLQTIVISNCYMLIKRPCL